MLAIISLAQQLIISLSCTVGLCGVGQIKLSSNEHSCSDNYQFTSAADYQSVMQHLLIRFR